MMNANQGIVRCADMINLSEYKAFHNTKKKFEKIILAAASQMYDTEFKHIDFLENSVIVYDEDDDWISIDLIKLAGKT